MSKYIVHINVLCVAIYIPFSLALWKYYLWTRGPKPLVRGPVSSLKFLIFLRKENGSVEISLTKGLLHSLSSKIEAEMSKY